MLDVKKLLTKLCKRVNFRVVQVQASSATTIAANGTAWITVPLPPSGTAIAVVGYYLMNGTTCIPYNISLSSSGASFAVKNMHTSSMTVTITANYLVVD